MGVIEIVFLLIGGLTIITTLVLAIKIPQPTVFQFWVFRVITALGSAFLGAVIPGFVELDGSIGEIAIRAGGAIALFLVVYLLNPPKAVVAFLK